MVGTRCDLGGKPHYYLVLNHKGWPTGAAPFATAADVKRHAMGFIVGWPALVNSPTQSVPQKNWRPACDGVTARIGDHSAIGGPEPPPRRASGTPPPQYAQ